MNINPALPHGAGSSSEAGRLEASRPAREQSEARHAETEAQPGAADSVEVSGAAKALADQTGDGAKGTSGLSAEHLKEISARVANGHYDRPEVIDRVAKGVLSDPDFHRAE